jgi:hypothetical protein
MRIKNFMIFSKDFMTFWTKRSIKIKYGINIQENIISNWLIEHLGYNLENEKRLGANGRH